MNEKEYLEDRLENQISWYSRESKSNQFWFKMLRLVEIVAAASIPFISGMADSICYSEWIIGFLGIGIAIAAASSALFKLQENWIQYRTTCEQLKHEKYLYLTKAQPYNSDNCLAILVQRVEGLISKENSSWAQHQAKNDEKVAS